MPDSRTPSTYDEPTVMWRMRRGERLLAHAVIAPNGPGAMVVWFINSHPLGMREFDDWSDAIAWSYRLCAQNWTTGWRFTPDD